MITHDVLAFSVAAEAVRRIRGGDPHWALLSNNVYPTSSRSWPMPDFVIVDDQNDVTIAAEFKPPNQSKREYLTGLGQALAYTKDFTFGLLIVPEFADDDYPIANHISQILAQEVATPLPLGLLRYDAKTLSPANAGFEVLRGLVRRVGAFVGHALLDNSFWAKWRDISPQELGLLLQYLYEEGRRVGGRETIRDRAFARLWSDIQANRALHWGGGPRHIADTRANQVAWGKNYRNFIAHIGWAAADGRLTEQGLIALRFVHQYGSDSRIFVDELAKTLLLAGKHLVLINAINEFQDSHGSFEDEQEWLDAIEGHLEEEGLLKRNPGRHAAAVRHSARGFLKAEKTIWKNLELMAPRGRAGGRAYHPNRGFIFDWSRITSLLTEH
jgi:hypothetical protein